MRKQQKEEQLNSISSSPGHDNEQTQSFQHTNVSKNKTQQLFSESESEDEGGRVLILSGGPDFNFDYEDSTQMPPSQVPAYMADKGFNSLCQAV